MRLPTTIYEIKPLALLFIGFICIFTLHPLGQIGGGLLIVAALLVFEMRKTSGGWKKGKYADVRITKDDRTKRRNY